MEPPWKSSFCEPQEPDPHLLQHTSDYSALGETTLPMGICSQTTLLQPSYIQASQGPWVELVLPDHQVLLRWQFTSGQVPGAEADPFPLLFQGMGDLVLSPTKPGTNTLSSWKMHWSRGAFI